MRTRKLIALPLVVGALCLSCTFCVVDRWNMSRADARSVRESRAHSTAAVVVLLRDVQANVRRLQEIAQGNDDGAANARAALQLIASEAQR